MGYKENIKSLLSEAQIYRDQGLLREAMELYENAVDLISNNKNIKNPEKLLEGIFEKIDSLKQGLDKLSTLQSSTEISDQVHDLIKSKFAFSDNEHEKMLEGAIALAKFGQYERALKEFSKLLHIESVRVTAAKNIIRCHFALESVKDAVLEYNDWLSGNRFAQEEIHQLNVFFQGLLNNKNMDITLASPPESGIVDFEQPEVRDDELMDISSVGITLESSPENNKMVELDVCFQNGNEINLLISSKDKDLIENLNVGIRLNDIQLYSPFAIFTGTGVVSAKTKIISGPKQGDFSMDIKVISS
jgi:tetratricopeptide (TPR) repeat protein